MWRYIQSFLQKRKTNHIIIKLSTVGPHFEVQYPFKIIGAEYIDIGDDFYSGSGTRIEAWSVYEGVFYQPKIIIGNNVRINGNAHIGAINNIKIGNNVLLGNDVFITDHSHGNCTIEEMKIPPTKRKLYSKGGVVIEDNVWIGEHAVVLPNVHIGFGTIIGANSVVTKSFPRGCIVAGNPAKVVKTLVEN